MKELSLAEIDNMEPLEYVAYLANMYAEMDYEMGDGRKRSKS